MSGQAQDAGLGIRGSGLGADAAQPPMLTSHYWVFTEQQLAAALDVWAQGMRANGLEAESADLLTEGVSRFLHSHYCIAQGMRRGGEESKP